MNVTPPQVLSGIDLEGGGRAVEPGYRLRQNIKIAMLYLEVGQGGEFGGL